MNMLKTNEIIALQGIDLDNAIDRLIYGATGINGPFAPAYSTDDALALKLIPKCNLFVARVEPIADLERPFTAGALMHDPQLQRDVTALRVTAPTMAVALCKAALLVVAKAAEAKAIREQSAGAMQASAQRAAAKNAAKREAARPKVTPGGYKGLKSRRKAAEAEAKKLAKANAPKTVKIQPVPTGPAQPGAFLQNPRSFAPLPKRKEIVIPQP